MIQIPDDPIIRSIEQTGYPLWIADDQDWDALDYAEGRCIDDNDD